MVTGVSQTTATAQQATATTASRLTNKDDFLKILVAQLKHQDPLEPLKPDQFLTQLSQLTQVEQLDNITKALTSMSTSSQAGNLAEWSSIVGKKISVDSNIISKGDEVSFTPLGDFDYAVVTLKDVKTGEVSTVKLNKGDNLTYNHTSENDVYVAVGAVKDGKSVQCSGDVFRTVRTIEAGTSGIRLIAANGDGYAINQIKKIKE